jgi:hypothetical protein
MAWLKKIYMFFVNNQNTAIYNEMINDIKFSDNILYLE